MTAVGFGFHVEDFDAAHADLSSRDIGGQTVPDHELWAAFIRDPDSDLLALMAGKPLPIKA